MMKIRSAILLAGSILAIAGGLAYANRLEVIDEDTVQRVMGVVIGVVLVICANLVPKNLEPLREGCDPSKMQALQRFTGWTLVLAGLGHAAKAPCML